MEDNIFWEVVPEVYPLFLEILILYATYRFSKGIFFKLQGKEEGISEALSSIFLAFFWAHLAIPIIVAMYYFTMNLGESLEPIIKTISGG